MGALWPAVTLQTQQQCFEGTMRETMFHRSGDNKHERRDVNPTRVYAKGTRK